MSISKTIMDFREDNIKYQQIYCKKISMHYEEYSEDILKCVFSAFFTPSVWEDAYKVYEGVVSSISFLDDEIPIVFIGGKSLNIFTRKKQSVGFFITDCTIYVLEASVLSDTLPKKFPYRMSINKTNQAIDKAIDSFDWDFLQAILPQNGKEEISQLILEIIIDIITLKKDLDIEHINIENSKNLSGRIIDLGLANESSVKIGNYKKYQKHFRKIHKKFGIPDDEHILLAITDSTLFGAHGCVITEQNVYSKDLLEQPERTAIIDIPNNYPVHIVGDSIRLGDSIIHYLPSSIDNKENVKQIIIEFLNKEITAE